MLAQRKQDTSELFLGQSIEKIRLVSASVCCFKQAITVSGMLYFGIMAGSQIVSAQRERFIEEETELYALIAGNAGIGSPPLPVFLAKIVNYVGLKFLLQVKLMVGDA